MTSLRCLTTCNDTADHAGPRSRRPPRTPTCETQAPRFPVSHLDYPSTSAPGWPIATGIIVGTCRHLAADYMDVTGARWSAAGAIAVLTPRAVRANGDFDQCRRVHLDRERQRVHGSRYADGVIPLRRSSLQKRCALTI